jgi:hypothetical protein
VRREKLVAEVEESSGTQSKGNVRRWKPLPSNAQLGLRRLSVCCTYNNILSVLLSEIAVDIRSYVLLSIQ